jgi:hypothetical protein
MTANPAFPEVPGQIQELASLRAKGVISRVMFCAVSEIPLLLAISGMASLCIRNFVTPDKSSETVLLTEIVHSLGNLLFQ